MLIYKVAAHTGANDNGYIEYNTETKEVKAHFSADKVCQRVVDYLTKEQEFHYFTGLTTYKMICAVPTSNLEIFKLSLCYIWTRANIYIDWSRPVDIDEI